jgi:threonine dehydratase
MPPRPTIDDCTAAAQRIADRVHRTPTFTSHTLGREIGRDVVLKAELFQRTGAFKLRGATNRVAAMTPAERAAGVATVSAGNHAQAAALACAEAGIDAVVFMPRAASAAKVAATRGYGATVDLDSADGAEAFARMREFAARTGRFILHPFDDPLVVAGNGTVGIEICADVPAPGAVLVPSSGGGLLAGVAIAVKALAPSARVIAVQAAATATLAASTHEARPAQMVVRGSATIADALTAPVFGELNAQVAAELVDEVVHLSEEEIRAAVRFLYARAKLACEPGAAVGAGALLAGRVADLGDGPAVAIVSGGNITPALAAEILAAA